MARKLTARGVVILQLAEAPTVLSGIDRRRKQKIGFWTRDQNDLGELPMVDTYTIEAVEKLPDKTVMERAERLLRLGVREQKDLGATFATNSPEVITTTHSRSVNDVVALAHSPLDYDHSDCPKLAVGDTGVIRESAPTWKNYWLFVQHDQIQR